MTQLLIDIPEEAFSVLRQTPREFAENLKQAAICKWYEMGLVSQSKGALLLGISRLDFIMLLQRYHVTVFQTSVEELEDECSRG